jgi:sortase A
MRYRVQVVGWTLIWSGLLIFGYVGWQIFVTDWLNEGVQAEAATDLIDTFAGPEPVAESVDTEEFLEGEEPPPDLPEVVEYFSEDVPPHGEPFAFLSIPKIGLDDVVVYEGVDRDTLKAGPGHMESTPLPGQTGNAVISGHRTTYGRPFFDFDLLEVGDQVVVETSIGTHSYEIREIVVVLPTDVWVTDPRPGSWLTMTTCEPKFSARQRLIVFAEMVDGPNLDWIKLNEARSPAT